MALLTFSWLLDLVVLLLSMILPLYLFYRKKFQFWAKLNVPHTNPSFPLGDLAGVNQTKNLGELFADIYRSYKGLRFVGIWSLYKPVLVIRDPEIIKAMFVKDFMSFHDRGVYVNEEDDPLSGHLFNIGGTKWRNLRAKLTPTFTSGKMKMMFPTLIKCSNVLKEVLSKPAKGGKVVEIAEICGKFTTDIISSCAFGIETNSLTNPNSEFREMGKKVFSTDFVTLVKASIPIFNPDLATLLRIKAIPSDVSEFFLRALRETMEYREQNNMKRNDFLQLLIQLKNKGKLDDVDETNDVKEKDDKIRKFTFEEAAAQAFVFFVAGFETSSTVMQFAMYELALNPDIQDITRKEIQTVLKKYNGEITYEGIYEMEYLGRLIDETLRKYPPVGVLVRESTREYTLPDTDITIPKGVFVQIPIFGIQMDPEYYPQPERFDPGRFTEEEKAKRHHYTYLPFGEGPRNCIGMRFGLMQTRIGLITMLANYQFEVCDETPIPMVFEPKSFVLSPKGGMNLKISAL